MSKESAVIIRKYAEAASVVASAARISTTEGDALGVFERAGNAEKDLRLIKKVLSSGHKSVMEHQMFSIAFNDVSVLVEQFMIEHRLASYTVKSRRYVDHSGAGYVLPEGLDGEGEDIYKRAMDALFVLYADLEKAGIPKEDARFVLPYSFRSNFYMTLNAREFIRLTDEMLRGRGAQLPEMRRLGAQLKAQFDEMYPGVLEGEAGAGVKAAPDAREIVFEKGGPAEGAAVLLSATPNPEEVLSDAIAFAGRFPEIDGDFVCDRNMLALSRDARPRELEFIDARFRIKDVSLACVTHFTRHRIQSLIVPDAARALAGGKYVVPESIRRDADLLAKYEAAFRAQTDLALELRKHGLSGAETGYLALSGHVTDIYMSMNGRELLHFLKLRTCNRAQWEIRAVARQMLSELQENCEEIFWVYGPSCLVDGRCPEGRLSCGHPVAR